MKRVLFALAALALIASCAPKPTVVTGQIKNYTGDPLLISMSSTFDIDTIQVAEDGSFRYEKMLDKVIEGMICVVGNGTTHAAFVPGKTYSYEVDMAIKPAIWTYTGNDKTSAEFTDYYHQDYANILKDPEPAETFKEHSECWDARLNEALAKLESVKDRKVKAFYKEKVETHANYNKFNYVWHLKMIGKGLDSDPDLNNFINSIDLNDEMNQKYFLSGIITIKTETAKEPESEALRHLKAIDETAPTQQLKDSLAASYLEPIFRDCKISSKEEGDALLAKAESLGTDEQTMKNYRELTEKALTLLPGCDEIDFEVVDQNGKVIKLSDFKGKAVYIDFWATWCLPCCMQIPYMEKMAEKYRNDKRIALISISLDKDVAAWNAKIAEDKPFWPQYRAADGGKAIQTSYGFNAIPRFMLFDKDGKIVNADAPRPQDAKNLSQLIDSTIN